MRLKTYQHKTNQKDIIEILSGGITWKKNLKIPQMNIHLDLLNLTLKKMPNKKTPGHNNDHEFWFKDLRPYMTDWPCNWVNIHKQA